MAAEKSLVDEIKELIALGVSPDEAAKTVRDDRARRSQGKPPLSTSLLSSSSFHPLFDFIFLFNSHAILSLLGFSFPVINLCFIFFCLLSSDPKVSG
jgi:hypothetical protein